MKSISKNIFLITLLILVNLAIYVFCSLLTDEGNYLWQKTDETRRFLVSLACMDLMRTQYFIYANTINLFLLGVYFFNYQRKTLGIAVAIISVGVYFGSKLLFKEALTENYYIIFQYQNVPEDFVLEPVKSAGNNIGKYLMKDIQNRNSRVRKYAVAGMGEIDYEPAIEPINAILHDLAEKPEIRGEAYLSLAKMSSEKAASYARIFSASVHPVADQATMDYIKGKGRPRK